MLVTDVFADFLAAGFLLAADALGFLTFLGESSSISEAEPDSSPENSSSLSSNSSSSLSFSAFQSALSPDVFLFFLDSSSSDESDY